MARMVALGSSIAILHAWLAVASVVLAAAVVVLGALDGIGTVRGRRWLDRLVLALLGATVAGALLGLGVLVGAQPPADPLHLVYGAAAVLAVPAARLIAGTRGSPRLGWWLAAGGLVTLGALLRLWATGG